MVMAGNIFPLLSLVPYAIYFWPPSRALEDSYFWVGLVFFIPTSFIALPMTVGLYYLFSSRAKRTVARGSSTTKFFVVRGLVFSIPATAVYMFMYLNVAMMEYFHLELGYD